MVVDRGDGHSPPPLFSSWPTECRGCRVLVLLRLGERDEHLTWKCSHHLGDIGVGMLGMEFEHLSIER